MLNFIRNTLATLVALSIVTIISGGVFMLYQSEQDALNKVSSQSETIERLSSQLAEVESDKAQLVDRVGELELARNDLSERLGQSERKVTSLEQKAGNLALSLRETRTKVEDTKRKVEDTERKVEDTKYELRSDIYDIKSTARKAALERVDVLSFEKWTPNWVQDWYSEPQSRLYNRGDRSVSFWLNDQFMELDAGDYVVVDLAASELFHIQQEVLGERTNLLTWIPPKKDRDQAVAANE